VNGAVDGAVAVVEVTVVQICRWKDDGRGETPRVSVWRMGRR